MRPFLACTRLTLAAYAAFFGLNAQAAEAGGVEAAFGNTVRTLYPDGRGQVVWIRPDGTWEGIGRRGLHTAGRWTQQGEKVCLRQSRPFPAPISYCTTFPAEGGVGARWTGRDLAGAPITLTLVPGIQRP